MKSKALLLPTLILAVVLYIAASSTTGHAQQGPSTVRVREVTDELRVGSRGVQVPGRIIGFSCVWDGGNYSNTRCYVATTD
jgi:hypothetical protein